MKRIEQALTVIFGVCALQSAGLVVLAFSVGCNDVSALDDPGAPHWALEDATGYTVHAIATPAGVLGLGEYTGDCVRVTWVGSEFVNGNYRLSDGTFNTCETTTYDAWTDTEARFTTGACEGRTYRRGWFVAPKYISVAGLNYYADPVGTEVPVWYRFVDGECTLDTTHTDLTLFEWLPVPEWVEGALDNGPYTLDLVYY